MEMSENDRRHVADLINFLDSSPVNFFACAEVCRRLDNAGFSVLEQGDRWSELKPGDRRYVVKNQSAVFAFIVGESDDPGAGFKLISAHSDSPGFRVKPKAVMTGEGGVTKLNTEVYGGPILYTWFDRPLSLAGRVILRTDDPLRPEGRLVRFDEPLLVIPHLAIHFNRAVNEGNHLSKQKDMLPVLGIIRDSFEAKNVITDLVAKKLGVPAETILDFDLSLYDTTGACIVGLNKEFISSGRLDDLSMVHAGLAALLESEPTEKTRVLAVFDNEETGSGTKQGAASPELEHLLRRIVECRGGDSEDYFRAVANSFLVSADNAHALHPNYVEKQDPTNHPIIGSGPVVKYNANCKYMTDADSAGVFKRICEMAEVPCQTFVNHSDVAGGSTLGNILTSKIPLRGVDMGAGIWAMHSCRETASVADHLMIIAAFTKFFS